MSRRGLIAMAALAVLAAAVLVPGAAAARAATRSGATTPSSSATARSAGTDWEAKAAGGAAASFAAVTQTTAKQRTVQLQDVVVQAPISCSDSPTPAAPTDVEVIAANVTVRAGGTFTTGSLKHGSGTVFSGRISGRRATISYRHVSRTLNQFDGSTDVCDTGTVKLTGAPGHRAAPADKLWAGQTATGEPVQLNVVAGGRALVEPPHPPADGGAQAAISFGQFSQTCGVGGCTPFSPDPCAYETPQALFIASNGTFGNAAWQEVDQPTFTGGFVNGHSVTGTFVNGGQGCEQATWSATPG